MLTREEAIRGLEYIESVAYGWNLNGLTLGKPTEEIESICAAAAHLLKAQEPRVMTLEEVKRLTPDDDVWIEYHGFAGWTISAVTVIEIYDNGMLCRLQCLRFNFDRYGCYSGDWMAWRCWTARPTDTQRRATPWPN